MFHKQTKMFVTYLRDEYPAAFNDFMIDIQNGGAFAASFSNRFGSGIAEMWNEFVDHVRDISGDEIEAVRERELKGS